MSSAGRSPVSIAVEDVDRGGDAGAGGQRLAGRPSLVAPAKAGPPCSLLPVSRAITAFAGCGSGPRFRGRGRARAYRVTRSCAVVRRLAGDRDVVDVALAQAGAGDAHEGAVLLHLGDRAVAGVAHRRPQAADQLVDDVADRPLVRHAALDALGHQLQRARSLPAGNSGRPSRAPSRRSSPCRGSICSCGPGRGRPRPGSRRCRRTASRASRNRRRRRSPWRGRRNT